MTAPHDPHALERGTHPSLALKPQMANASQPPRPVLPHRIPSSSSSSASAYGTGLGSVGAGHKPVLTAADRLALLRKWSQGQAARSTSGAVSYKPAMSANTNTSIGPFTTLNTQTNDPSSSTCTLKPTPPTLPPATAAIAAAAPTLVPGHRRPPTASKKMSNRMGLPPILATTKEQPVYTQKDKPTSVLNPNFKSLPELTPASAPSPNHPLNPSLTPPNHPKLSRSRKRKLRKDELSDALSLPSDLKRRIELEYLAEPQHVPIEIMQFFTIKDELNDDIDNEDNEDNKAGEIANSGALLASNNSRKGQPQLRLRNQRTELEVLSLSAKMAIASLDLTVPSPPLRKMSGKNDQALTNSQVHLGPNFHIIRFSQMVSPSRLMDLRASIPDLQDKSVVSGRRNDNTRRVMLSSPASDFNFETNSIRGLTSDVVDPARDRTYRFGYLSDGSIVGLTEVSISESDALRPAAAPVLASCEPLLSILQDDILLSIRHALRRRIYDSFARIPALIRIEHDKAVSNKTVSPQVDRLHFRGLATTGIISDAEHLIPTHPHIAYDHGDTPSIMIQLSGPITTIRFPQLHVDVEMTPGDVVVAPLANLVHHLVESDPDADSEPDSGPEKANGADAEDGDKHWDIAPHDQGPLDRQAAAKGERLFMILYSRRNLEEEHQI